MAISTSDYERHMYEQEMYRRKMQAGGNSMQGGLAGNNYNPYNDPYSNGIGNGLARQQQQTAPQPAPAPEATKPNLLLLLEEI